MFRVQPRIRRLPLLVLALLSFPALARAQVSSAGCARMLEARVVALDQVFFWNRYGALEPQGMIYALERDIVATSPTPGSEFEPGKVALRRDKRPRPLVLRMNVGDCISIHFRNLLADDPVDEQQPHTRNASIHVIGMQLVDTIRDDGSNVGVNSVNGGNGVVAPGDSITYVLYAEREGGYLMHSMGAVAGGEGDGGSISAGLFGAINVEPKNSEWYRSQVTREELRQTFVNSPLPAGAHPQINYNATYPSGQPILKMLHGNEIIYSDLTAVITGPNAGNFDSTYPYQTTPLYPDRNQPFREFTIIFHDEIGAVQAFPHFEDEILQHPLHSARDAFAINYGTGGIGAEILANRIGVGPVHDCDECKYEEFFLSSWAVGDPAMVVDTPASKPCTTQQLREGRNCQPQLGRKAERAFYPDDPSNVYHSYLNEHVKFRNLHAGTDDHHVFHLHAHQWVHTPRADKSAYLDSQTIGQGASFTYEIAYRGSGNRNRTVGDAIFHCHFYPHFAQGMWGLWRVHDVLELGTQLDNEGKPVAGARALPDGEIPRGTPIPAVVPIPVLPMAPLPGHIAINDGQVDLATWDGKHPGYPFFIPGRAGRRPPHPPLDTIHDGGLPRHVVLSGLADSTETRHDFSKVVLEMEVDWLDELGEPIEKKAMEFHENAAGYPAPTPKGVVGGLFKVNGAPRKPGAPFADPCINDNGTPVTDMRYYKAADIQLDTFLNKKAWHFPQQRIISLWKDVDDYLNPGPGTLPKAPEPLFFRAESGECIEFWLANLTPSEYHLDDYQVRTPTDILGQHIHLVKFDVTSSDGAANGFNYEDGSFAPEEVQERIEAIRAFNKCEDWEVDPEKCPEAEPHPFFGQGHDADCDQHDDWLGAQTTVQRWWADPITMLQGGERTIRTVFTHDHFGPSTHQQVGLYAGLVVEPKNSNWFHNESGVQLSTDNLPGLEHDGGPTSWQARVEGPSEKETYREFMVAFADFQHAYEPGSPLCPVYSGSGNGLADPARVINPPARKELPPPVLYEKPDVCPTNEHDPDGPILPNPEGILPPCPELVSADDVGMVAVNYRNEPVALRVLDPDTKKQSVGQKGDLSFAYATIDREDPALNVQPGFYLPLTQDLEPQDPFTPLMRVFEGDRVHVRTLVGAHEEPHNFTINGLKWLAEPDYPNSGWRNSQATAISEWFDLVVPRVPSLDDGDLADFLYRPSAATEWQWTGMWGLIRVYRAAADLPALSTNSDGRASTEIDAELKSFTQADAVNQKIPGADKEPTTKAIKIVCPNDIPVEQYRTYNIVAVWAKEALQDDPITVDGLVYNRRDDVVKIHQDDWEPPQPSTRKGPLHDPTAILFVRHEDLDWVPSPNGPRPRVKQTVRREPLILRAKAGECVRINLHNAIGEKYEDLDGWNAMPMIIEGFNANDVDPSLHVGLHPQLVYYDIRRSDGMNVGLNPQYAVQTVPPGETIRYFWYTGDYVPDARPHAIEFGSTGLSSADPVKHSNKAAVGALIVEPPNATWTENHTDADGKLTRASATINTSQTAGFFEFVTVFQDDVNMRYADGAPVENLEVGADPEGTGGKAVNYRTEPLWFRIGLAPDWPAEDTREITVFDQVLSNAFIGGQDPETPVFETVAGKTVRFRSVHPGGHTQSHVFDLHGHIWEELPYIQSSSLLGTNNDSEWQGARGGHGPSNHFDVLVKNGAGGKFAVPGDYIYRDYAAWLLDGGIWGLLRVHP